MAFSLGCPSCRKMQEPVIDKSSNEVYCSLCDELIPNVSHFVKVQMKTIGQIKRPKKSTYAIECISCKIQATPILKNNKLLCPSCSKEYVLARAFELLIKDALKKENLNDID